MTKSCGDKKTDEAIEALIKSQTFSPIPWANDHNQSDCTIILAEPLPIALPSPAIRGLRMTAGESVNATCGQQKISIGSGASVTGGGTITVGGGKDAAP